MGLTWIKSVYLGVRALQGFFFFLYCALYGRVEVWQCSSKIMCSWLLSLHKGVCIK